MPDPLLHAIVQATADVCQAEHAWLLVPDGGGMRVEAAAAASTVALGQHTGTDAGVASFVFGSRQPAALGGSSIPATGVATQLGVSPRAVLAVPCEDAEGELRGVIELVDPRTGAMFSLDDIELASLLAGLCGVALDRLDDAPPPEVTLDELGRDLAALAGAMPARYAAVAGLIRSVSDG